MSLQVYNTLTKNKEPFKSVEPGKVKMYLCGPTVYDFLHIGNFRGAIVFNLIRNWLEHSGYEVTFVYNYTDVDDKIIKRAQEENVTATDISERFIKEFEQDIKTLGLRPHDHNPRVTEFMPQIIKFVEDLVENKKAYVIEGEVFFAIDDFEAYGKLSGKKLDELNAGQRVEVDKRKKNPFDFVLWKPSKEGEPSWQSPWGNGRPGWHIECSAMIQSILGETIDIHGGGIDLIFPHHENEIAQGEGRTGKPYCNFWMHNNFINMNKEKMSKSLGNIVTGRSFMERYNGEILKYLYLSVHYRSHFSVDDDKVLGVIGSLDRIYASIEEADNIIALASDLEAGKVDVKLEKELKKSGIEIERLLNDDFNTAGFIGKVFENVRLYNSLNLLKKKKITPEKLATAKAFRAWMAKYGKLASLFEMPATKFRKELNDILVQEKGISKEKVEEILKLRTKAREEKDWAASDQYRDQLVQMGIELHDGNEERPWSVKI